MTYQETLQPSRQIFFEDNPDTTDYLNAFYDDFRILGAPLRPTAMPGDANGDGGIDLSDLAMVASAFNTSPPSIPTADFNDDDVVDVYDLVMVGINFGKLAF